MKRYLYIMIVMAAVCGVPLGIVSCDKDCPVCPPPVTEPVSDYDVYISGTYAHAVYVYNTASKTITDTIPLPGSYYTLDIGISGDGRNLLVLDIGGGLFDRPDLTIIDLETLDTVKAFLGLFDYISGTIEVSNTGKYIAISGEHGIYFLDGTTFELLFSDTVYIESGRFTYNDSLFYGQRGLTNYFVYDLSAESLAVKDKYVDENGYSPHIWAIQPTHDRSAYFMFVRYGQTSNWFISYRPGLDSTGIWLFMGPPGGDLRISPDGKTILASDPGFVVFGEMGSQMLIAANVVNDGITVISPGYSEDGSFALLAGDIAFTPDSRYAMVTDEVGWGVGLLDMKTLRYVDVQRSPGAEGTTSLAACQRTNKLKGGRTM